MCGFILVPPPSVIASATTGEPPAAAGNLLPVNFASSNPPAIPHKHNWSPLSQRRGAIPLFLGHFLQCLKSPLSRRRSQKEHRSDKRHSLRSVFYAAASFFSNTYDSGDSSMSKRFPHLDTMLVLDTIGTCPTAKSASAKEKTTTGYEPRTVERAYSARAESTFQIPISQGQ